MTRQIKLACHGSFHCFLGVLILFSHLYRQSIADDLEVDPELKFFEVAPIDRETCVRDGDCDDWCKEQGQIDSRNCICRCPTWISHGEFSCKNGTTHCQVAPRKFWGGSFNITNDRFKSVCSKHEYMLMGFSASSCRHCIDFEPAYRLATPALSKLGIPLARIDADLWKIEADGMLQEKDITSLPVIKVVRKCKNLGQYKGPHSAPALKAYGEKLKAPSIQKLESIEAVNTFASAYNVSIIAFFERGDDEEEEKEEYEEAAEALRPLHNVFLGLVRSKPVARHFRETQRWFKSSPSVVIVRNFDQGDQDRDTLLLTELSDKRLQDWISARTVRIVDELTGSNFLYYESLRLPMLLLFIDKKIDNRGLLSQFKSVARRYQGRVSFAYLDGEQHAARRLALGLVGDPLPSMAFNTLDGRLHPFPIVQRIHEKSIKDFTEDFLAGRLKPHVVSQSQSEVEKVTAQAAKDGAEGLVEVTYNTFEEICMDASHDVVVLFYSSASPTSKDLWPYYKKTVERFRALKINSMKIARFDISRNQLPKRLDIESFPAIVMFPAKDKDPPYKLFHGKAKVRPIMLWAQEMASIKFEFPNDTPHLDDEQRKAYLVQIKERDEHVAEKRSKDREARRAKLDKESSDSEQKHNKRKAGGEENDKGEL